MEPMAVNGMGRLPEMIGHKRQDMGCSHRCAVRTPPPHMHTHTHTQAGPKLTVTVLTHNMTSVDPGPMTNLFIKKL